MDPSARTPLLIPGPSSSDPPRLESLPERDIQDQDSSCDRETTGRPTRRLQLYNGIAIVLGLQIGSGIFVSPSLVARNAGSAPAALTIWCIGGTMAWACAACYIELGSRMPVNGGPQEYLHYCFNDLVAFLASWACIFTVKPCSAAILALVIADYLNDIFQIKKGTLDYVAKLIALSVLALVIIINCVSNRASNAATNSFLACKVFGVGFVIVMGLVTQIVPHRSPLPIPDELEAFPKRDLGNYTDATLSAMWAYSGWETLSFVAGELKSPERNIALVTNISMAVVIILFLLANIAYFSALPFATIAASASIGLTFSLHFFQRAGGALFTLVICLSSLGSLNIKIFTAGRLTQAAAERHYLPSLFKTIARRKDKLHLQTEPRTRFRELLRQPTTFRDGSIPFSAIIFNGTLAASYILIVDFSSLVIFIGIVEYSVAFATLAGLLTLRFLRKPVEHCNNDPALFQVPWLLIFVSLVATGVMVSVSAIRHPVAGIGFITFCGLSAVIHTRLVRVTKHH